MHITEQVRELKLPAGSYAVFGSGPLAVRGMRPSGDIDIIVTDELFEELAKDGSWETDQLRDRFTCLKRGTIEIFHTWAPGSWDPGELIKHADTIDGVPYVRLESVIEWKRLRDLPKDRTDIELIEHFLAMHH